MAETPQTPEGVAYQLLKDIVVIEGAAPPDRAALLATFAECLRVTRPEVAKIAPTHGRSAF